MEATELMIPRIRLEGALRELNKVLAKAAKWGGTAHYELGPVEERTWIENVFGRNVTRRMEYVTVVVGGEAPTYGDYELVARIDRTPEGNVICAVPGGTLGPEYQNTDGRCEHCHNKRLRKQVYVVESRTTGARMQVGRTCLRDALGVDSPAVVARRFTWLTELRALGDEEGGGGWRSGPSRYGTVMVVALAAAVVRRWGWSSSSMEKPTSGRVMDVLEPPRGNGPYERQVRALAAEVRDSVTEDDLDTAEAARTWALGTTDESDYMHNLRVVLAADDIEMRRIGLAVSLFPAYERAQERDVRLSEQRRVGAASSHVGTVGERLRKVRCTVERQTVVGSNEWGDTVLNQFRDAEDNVLIWFTGRSTGHDNGEEVLLTGTVKDHSTYNDVAQTTLTRCKVEEVE